MRLSRKTKQQTDKPKPVLTKEEKKENKMHPPQEKATNAVKMMMIMMAMKVLVNAESQTQHPRREGA